MQKQTQTLKENASELRDIAEAEQTKLLNELEQLTSKREKEKNEDDQRLNNSRAAQEKALQEKQELAANLKSQQKMKENTVYELQPYTDAMSVVGGVLRDQCKDHESTGYGKCRCVYGQPRGELDITKLTKLGVDMLSVTGWDSEFKSEGTDDSKCPFNPNHVCRKKGTSPDLFTFEIREEDEVIVTRKPRRS